MPDAEGGVVGAGDYACVGGVGGVVVGAGSAGSVGVGTGFFKVDGPDGGGVAGEDGDAGPVVKVFAVEPDCVVVACTRQQL